MGPTHVVMQTEIQKEDAPHATVPAYAAPRITGIDASQAREIAKGLVDKAIEGEKSVTLKSGIAYFDYQGSRPTEGTVRVSAPKRFSLVAARGADTVRLGAVVEHALASELAISGVSRYFLQMRGRFTLTGRVMGEVVSDSGMGFFETYTDSSAAYSSAVGSPSTDGCDHSHTASASRC